MGMQKADGTKRGDSGDLDKFREKGRSWMGQREKNWAEKEEMMEGVGRKAPQYLTCHCLGPSPNEM